VGRPGTRQLSGFIACQKTYEAVALFGCDTDTYDSEGKIVRRAAYSHITKEDLEKALESFRGEIMQKPPMYSFPFKLVVHVKEYTN
jgi:tRNA pseudouridine55 synthase